MTDNEKRAHDLAIAVLPDLMKLTMYAPSERIVNGKIELQYNHFVAYFDAYSKFLSDMNQTFTDSDPQCR